MEGSDLVVEGNGGALVVQEAAVFPFKVHQEITKDELKSTIAEWAVRNGVRLKITKSDPGRLYYACSNDECRFYLRSCLAADKELFRVSSFDQEHTCVITDHYDKSRFVPTLLIKKSADKAVAANPEAKAATLINQVRNDYGAGMTYHIAYRTLKAAREAIQGSFPESFARLRSYLTNLASANPGTHWAIKETAEHKFQGAFLAFGAANISYENCRKMISLDAAHLTNLHGMLFTATGFDAVGSIVPLGFATFPGNETYDRWVWFIENLKAAIPSLGTGAPVVFSDRDKGLKEAVASMLPNAYPAHCVRHIEGNLATKFGKKKFHTRMKEALWELAKCKSTIRSKEILNEMRGELKEAAEYLEGIGLDKFCCAEFPVKRYGVLTSNNSESLNAAMKDVRSQTIVRLFDSIREIVTRWYTERSRTDRSSWMGNVSPKIQQAIAKGTPFARQFRIENPHVADAFNVITHNGNNRIVIMAEQTCSCNEFQETGYPCVHAQAVLLSKGIPFSDHVDPYFKADKHSATYAPTFTPVDLGELQADDLVFEPDKSRKRGRPKSTRRRKGAAELEDEAARNCCKKCGQPGHNSRTCRAGNVVAE